MQKFNRIVEEVLAHPMAFCLPQMPTNRCGLVNGSKIVAVKDYPFFGIVQSEEVALMWDGEFVRHAHLTWAVDGMVHEIEQGFWTVANE